MIKTDKEIITIICDKCKFESIAPKNCYNDVFFEEGWALHKGKKYIHLCRKCQSKRSREAMDWARQRFLQFFLLSILILYTFVSTHLECLYSKHTFPGLF